MTDVACRQGTLTPPDTWSRPFGTSISSTCSDQSFFQTCRDFSGLCSSNIPRYFLDFAPYIIAARMANMKTPFLVENEKPYLKSVLCKFLGISKAYSAQRRICLKNVLFPRSSLYTYTCTRKKRNVPLHFNHLITLVTFETV